MVNDSEMKMWRDLGISTWPTLVVVSPQGKLLCLLAGEGHKQDLADFVAAALEYYGGRGMLDNSPVPRVRV